MIALWRALYDERDEEAYAKKQAEHFGAGDFFEREAERVDDDRGCPKTPADRNARARDVGRMSIEHRRRPFHQRSCRQCRRVPRSGPRRVAIFGGDARQERRWARCRWATHGAPRFFRSCRDGGNGELPRLLAAVRGGSIHLVVILARWNGHAATRTVQRACRRAGIRAIVVR